MGTMEQNNRRNTGTVRRQAGTGGQSRAAGSGRSAGLSRPDSGMRGGNGMRPARKSKKDIAKDKMIILLEVLCGLLLVSLVAVMSAKALGMLNGLDNLSIGKKTMSAVKMKILLIIIAEMLGIVVLFGGMVYGRVNPHFVPFTSSPCTSSLCDPSFSTSPL